MNRNMGRGFALLCALAMAVVLAAPAIAQSEKPPMYTYVGNWSIPRAQWAEMDKASAADDALLTKGLAAGTIIGYGSDVNLVHQADGTTHDDWWSSTSMAGLMNMLDQFYKAGTSTSPVLASATKHSDQIFVSRCYHWQSGSWKDIYSQGGAYKLKADAPDDAVEIICKNIVEPLMEKLLADGTIHEYELDTEAIHTESPDMFYIFYIAANAEALDKVRAALREATKANPLRGPAFSSMVDYTAHRDMLVRSVVTYK